MKRKLFRYSDKIDIVMTMTPVPPDPIYTSLVVSGYNDFCTRDNGGPFSWTGSRNATEIYWGVNFNTDLTYNLATDTFVLRSDCIDLSNGGSGTQVVSLSFVGDRVVGTVILPTSSLCTGCTPNNPVTFAFS